ncbi:MAG: MipA/OmpV family protein [Verrucomicrobia bacterium]|nr:MipA/OmpV family protein [Verrucomicrobiota bacterium]
MTKALLSGLVAALVLVFVGTAAAQEDLKISIGADLVSDYIWRGIPWNEDGAIQPWVNLDYAGFTAQLWASMDLDDTPNDAQWEFSEFRLLGSYGIPVAGYMLDVGAIYYDYPNTDLTNTFEVFGTFTFTGVTLTPYVSLYYDVDEVEGFYLRVGGSYGQELESFEWLVGVSLGAGSEDYNEGYYGVSEFALNDLTATLTATMPFSEQFSAKAFVTASWLVGDDIKDAVEDDSSIGFGAGVSYTF